MASEDKKEFSKSKSMEIEFREIFKVIKKYKSATIRITFISLLASFIYSTFARKTWEGYIKIVLNNTEPPVGMLSGDKRLTVPTALGIADNSKLNTEVEILKSPSVLLPVFEYVKLDKKNNGDNIKKFYFSKWFEKNLSIRLERGTTVLKINYRDTDKKRIINSLDKIIKEYQDFPQRTKINQLDREIEYLEKQYLIQNNFSC